MKSFLSMSLRIQMKWTSFWKIYHLNYATFRKIMKDRSIYLQDVIPLLWLWKIVDIKSLVWTIWVNNINLWLKIALSNKRWFDMVGCTNIIRQRQDRSPESGLHVTTVQSACSHQLFITHASDTSQGVWIFWKEAKL